jgi:hypothetical protein
MPNILPRVEACLPRYRACLHLPMISQTQDNILELESNFKQSLVYETEENPEFL